jgi:hypothetical protein
MSTQINIGSFDGIPATGGILGPNGAVSFGAPDVMNVLFYTKSVHDPISSRERGKPWFRAMTYVRIQHPGEKDCIDRPVQEDDVAIQRWPRQWDAFQRRQEQAPDGVPIEMLFPESPEVAANMHTIAIHTVEQLAGLTEHGMQTIGIGAAQWKNKARQFLDAARGGASVHRMQLQIEKLTNAIETLSNQNAGLKALVDRLSAEKAGGVPPAMIPNSAPTQAQAYAATAPTYQPMAELSDEPLFETVDDDPPAGVSGPSIGELAEGPRPRGWPKGKPRGSRNSQQQNRGE